MADRDGSSSRESALAKKKQLATVVSYALFALLLLLLLILCIGSLADGCGSTEETPTESGASTPTDKIKFGTYTITSEDTKTGSLVLANALNDYVADEASFADVYAYRSAQHKGNNPYQLSGMFSLMDKTALEALDRMLTDCAKATDSKDVLVRTGYLTEKERTEHQSLLREHADDWKTGLGVELRIRNSSGNGNSKLSSNPIVQTWLNDNAAKYGFVVRYPTEKTELTGVAEYTDYFRYVGVAHASYMKAEGLCLEEYLVKLLNYTSKDRLSIRAADGKTYEVYFCEVAGSTQISCPTNYAYSTSGTTVITSDGTTNESIKKSGVVVAIDRSTLVDPTPATDTTDGTADGTGTTAEPSTDTTTP